MGWYIYRLLSQSTRMDQPKNLCESRSSTNPMCATSDSPCRCLVCFYNVINVFCAMLYLEGKLHLITETPSEQDPRLHPENREAMYDQGVLRRPRPRGSAFFSWIARLLYYVKFNDLLLTSFFLVRDTSYGEYDVVQTFVERHSWHFRSDFDCLAYAFGLITTRFYFDEFWPRPYVYRWYPWICISIPTISKLSTFAQECKSFQKDNP